jgi:hypothetical protein
VAVEKLFLGKFAKIKLRQDALLNDLLGSQDIFYPPKFARLGWNASFSTATGDSTSLRFCFASEQS